MTLQELEALVERLGYSGLTAEQLAELDAYRSGALAPVSAPAPKPAPVSKGKAKAVEVAALPASEIVPAVDQYAKDFDGA